jgi:eukaryotic-like serine/threonine-protein kinase
VCVDDPALRRDLESLLALESGGDDKILSGSFTQPLASLVGQTVGSYEVISLLGAGGMGQVYRARDTRLNREVAFKILPGLFALDVHRLARFRQEALMLASLNHPNIAQIYGVEEARGTYGLVLELVEGPTLADRIARGPLPVQEAFALARQIADALHAAHARGIVHRDLKPADIKVRPDGTVKVLDFGLAKVFASETIEVAAGQQQPVAPMATSRGVILGTAPYMAPEQVRGRESDARVDIWAFGVTLYEMLTGRSPFAGETLADTVGAVLHKEPEWQEVPEGVQPVLRGCLEKNPSHRLATIADVRTRLDSVPSRRFSRRAAWAAGAAATLALAAGGAWLAPFKRVEPAGHPVRFQIPAPSGWAFANYHAVSPDGRNVAFIASDAEGRREIWIHSLERGESRPLQRTGPLATSSIFWSADSRSIGFVGSDNNMKRIAIAAGPPQTITPVRLGWGGATWTPNDVIVFGQREGGVMRVSAKGGTPSPLTELDRSRGEVGHGGPRLLPDGRHFIYSRASSVPANNALYVGSLDASPGDQSSEPLLATESRPAYAPSPDGRRGHVLVVRAGVLLAYPFDAERLTLAGEPVPIAEGVGALSNGPVAIALVSAAASGALTYRNVEDSRGMPVWLDRNGRQLDLIVKDPLASPSFPRVSPDGTRIALTVGGNLWVYHVDGRPPIKLTFDNRLHNPIWTPDGRRILYEDDNGRIPLRWVPADRVAQPEEVGPPGRFHPYGWAPDGSVLATALVARRNADGEVIDTDIVMFKPEAGATVKTVVRTPALEGEGGLALSTDNRWLAYTSSSTGRTEIWVQPMEGEGPPVRVSANGGVDPRWAPRGDELYYLEAGRVMAVPVRKGGTFEFGPPTALFENRYWTENGLASYDVAPDGRFLTMASGPFFGTSPINVILNWTQLLRSQTPRD